jgi:predicted transcriptional regulator
MTETKSIKEQARLLVERLADDATWDDVLYAVFVRQSIEAGLEDSHRGRLVSTEEMCARLGFADP